jgi:hypothetical protein
VEAAATCQTESDAARELSGFPRLGSTPPIPKRIGLAWATSTPVLDTWVEVLGLKSVDSGVWELVKGDQVDSSIFEKGERRRSFQSGWCVCV